MPHVVTGEQSGRRRRLHSACVIQSVNSPVLLQGKLQRYLADLKLVVAVEGGKAKRAGKINSLDGSAK